MKEKNVIKSTLILSIILYTVALTQTAFCTEATDCTDSLFVLLMGSLACLGEFRDGLYAIIYTLIGRTTDYDGIGAAICWAANPIIILSLFIFKRNKKITLILSIISTMFILMFLMFDKVQLNISGGYYKIISLKLGYWLWLSSSLVILIGSLIAINLKPYERF